MVTDTRADLSHHLPKNLQALMLASTAAIENEAAAAVGRFIFLTVSTAGGFAMGAFLAPLAQTASPDSVAATGLKPTHHPRHISALHHGAYRAKRRRVQWHWRAWLAAAGPGLCQHAGPADRQAAAPAVVQGGLMSVMP